MRRATRKDVFPTSPGELSDPLAEMARIRVAHVLSQDDGTASLQGTVEELLEQSLAQNPTGWSEATRNVMRGVVEGLGDRDDAQHRIRAASETAVLAVARRWGNIVSAGKATVTATREAAGKTGLDSRLAAQQASLGAMEGALRAGPIVYPILQQELSPIVEDFDQVLHRERRSFYVEAPLHELPMIVTDPYLMSESAPVEDIAPVASPGMEPAALLVEDLGAAELVRQTLAEEDEFEAVKPERRAEIAPQTELPTRPEPAPGLWKRFVGWVSRLLGKG